MSDLIVLTGIERQRFQAYLEQEAATIDKLIGQLENIPAGQLIAGKYRQEQAACLLIARKFAETETMAIGAGSGG